MCEIICYSLAVRLNCNNEKESERLPMRLKIGRGMRFAVICLIMSVLFLSPVTPVYGLSAATVSAAAAIQQPVATLKDGRYLEFQSVSLSCKTKGAAIYYTTNGKAPTNASKKYTKPIILTEDFVLRAVAIKNGVKSKELVRNYMVYDYSEITDDVVRYQTAIENNKVNRLSESDQAICKTIQSVINVSIKEGMTDYEKAKAIHDFIINSCVYDTTLENPYELPDSSFRIEGVILKEIAVCQGYAETFELFMNLLDIENEFVIGTAGGVGHAWNLVKLDGNWYHIDTTWDDPVAANGEQFLRYNYFLVPDEIISEDHVWATKSYPACTSKDLMYKVYDEYIIDSVSKYSSKFSELYNKGLRDITILYPENTRPNMDFLYDLTGKTSYYYNNPEQFGDYYIYTVYIK